MLMAQWAIHAAQAQQPFDLDTNYRTIIEQRYVNSLIPQADGKVIISGRMRFPEFPLIDKLLARLEADGTLDQSFSASSLGGGKLTAWNGIFYVGTAQTVRRILAEGSQDPAFIEMNLGPYFSSGQGGDYHVYPDGRVLMTGLHVLSDSVRGFEGFYSLVWFSNTGYLDTTTTHRQCDGSIDFIHALPDGKFLLSGVFTSYEGQPAGRIIRIHPDGALDTSFNTSIHWGQAYGCHVQSDGKILAAGRFQVTGDPDTLHLIRLMPDGTLDPTFNNHLRSAYHSYGGLVPWGGITPVPPLGLLVYGAFTSIDEQTRGGIALVDTAGALLDTYFTGSGCGVYEHMGFPYSSVESIAPDPVNGGFYICGAYHGYDDGTVNDSTQRFVSRLYGLDVGVQEPQASWPGELTLHPNPAGTSTTVRFSSAATRELTLVLRDPLGRLVHTERLPPGQNAHSIELSHLPEGVYVISVEGTAAPFAPARLVVSR